MVSSRDNEIPAIIVRRPRINFEDGINPFYVKNNPIASHMASAFNFAVPDGEKFFIHSVRLFQNRILDSKLKSEIKGFFGQEVQHQNHHFLSIQAMENQGYPVKGWMRWMKWYYGKLLRWFPAGWQLSYTAGCEHLTASIAHAALKSRVLEDGDPVMKRLWIWHSIEEIEHKHVVFDILKTVHPRNYFLRLLGFFHAFFGISFFIFRGCLKMLRHDMKNKKYDFAQLKNFWVTGIRTPEIRTFLREMASLLTAYLKPGFHPQQIQDELLLEQYRPELSQFT